ncbi:MAG: hypothetical protein A2Y62_02115 [Candidatus Fischerbacteria bacterium RBG_13_37_8]|uniref:NTP pyrophosphohydrolase MazG putative catalytic core domain-containing protein n=1 Tax=Candidatus Fischerbacteria bacterium RBG_13_37_8 TaxID=1817863 RepID=A0A1F5VJM5_9BACT|nr:MAG: hypothetical protein A2Y62_02115 [Candidatus Fischerbacteria bacterium RBG_13_37_8]
MFEKNSKADIAIYLFDLADNLKLDLSEAILKKLELNRKKYPAHKAKEYHTCERRTRNGKIQNSYQYQG